MEEESAPKEQEAGRHANDSHRTDGDDDADIAPRQQIDGVVPSIARLIGRQIAREQFEVLQADNDNTLSDRQTWPEGEMEGQDWKNSTTE